VRDLVAHIECPARVLYADPAPPYFPEALRRERAAMLPRGEVQVIAGGHHLHMEDPATVASAIGGFLTAWS
jgi:pimeloyl-ACP methyl ester carboxylesterase